MSEVPLCRSGVALNLGEGGGAGVRGHGCGVEGNFRARMNTLKNGLRTFA